MFHIMYLVNSRLFKNPQLTIDHLEVEFFLKINFELLMMQQ
jgi:hypothetical protein